MAAQDITASLTSAQVAAALAAARLANPSATNAQLRSELEFSALHGPGIIPTIRQWHVAASTEAANTARREAMDAVEALFPAPAEPEA